MGNVMKRNSSTDYNVQAIELFNSSLQDLKQYIQNPATMDKFGNYECLKKVKVQ